MDSFSQELTLRYPRSWEDEYRNSGFVKLWRSTYPSMFEDITGSGRHGTLDLFPQYALMFLLRRYEGIQSITWYKMASTPERSANKTRTLKYWKIMQRWMGKKNFKSLRDALLTNGFEGFTGEPDLFCWNPDSEIWFFAEAKGKDSLTAPQQKWFQICQSVLGNLSDIRVYRLVPEDA